MLNKGLWYSILTIAVAGFVLLGSGLYQAMKTTLERPRTPAATALAQPSAQPGTGTDPGQASAQFSRGQPAVLPPDSPNTQASETPTGSTGTESTTGESPSGSAKDPNTFHMLILGDSIAKGTGDESGKGFSGYLPSILKNGTAKDITVENAGIDGLESGGLLEQLQSQRLAQPLAKADIILISIGGNDVRRILSANPLQKEETFKSRQDLYLNRLKLSLQELRKANPDATIVFLGLYNPYERPEALDDIRLLHTWNHGSQQLVEADSKAIFIPSHDLLKYNLSKYLAPDGMHPNGAGYQALAQRIGQSLVAVLPK